MSTVTLDIKGFEKVEKELDKFPTIKVGLRADNEARQDDSGMSNTDLGLLHEYGGATMPMRSFLRLPLFEKLPEKFAEATKGISSDIDTMQLANNIGALGVATVMEAFDTGGFGQWKESDYSRKRNAQTLVETAHLKRSIAYEVSDDD